MPETLIDCIPRLISTFVLQKEYDVINIKSCKTTTFDKLAKKWNEEKEKVLSLLAYVLDRGAEWFEKEWI